jgi:hypothetical protein
VRKSIAEFHNLTSPDLAAVVPPAVSGLALSVPPSCLPAPLFQSLSAASAELIRPATHRLVAHVDAARNLRLVQIALFQEADCLEATPFQRLEITFHSGGIPHIGFNRSSRLKCRITRRSIVDDADKWRLESHAGRDDPAQLRAVGYYQSAGELRTFNFP